MSEELHAITSHEEMLVTKRLGFDPEAEKFDAKQFERVDEQMIDGGYKRYECRCGAEFRSINAAETHLREEKSND